MRFLRLASLCGLVAVAGCAVSEAQDFANIAPGKNKDGGGSSETALDPDAAEKETAPTDSFVGEDTTPGETSDSSAPDTKPIDTGAPDTGIVDTGTPDTGIVDTGTPDTGIVDTGTVETGGTTTITFPASPDPRLIKYDPNMWNKGDYVEGTRTAGASITSISGNFQFTNTIAPSPCGSPFPFYTGVLDVNVTVNGTKVGAMKITQASGASLPFSATFPAITGPSYKIRYEALANVSPGCGSIAVLFDVSMLTLK